MGDKEEAENDRRKLMNKIFCSALTAVVAGAMLTGCAMPWEKGADDDVAPGGYSYTADSNSEQKQAYRWLIEPTINADNIISFDGSQVDPNNEKNTAYANYSVIRQNGKYGIIDYSGNMVVPAEYDDYYTCWCGEVTLFNIINEKKEYEYYFDELAEIEEKYYRGFVKQFSRRENMVSGFFIHVICRTGWSYIYEVVSHDLSYDEAQIFMKSIREFCFAGWGKVLGQNYEDLGL